MTPNRRLSTLLFSLTCAACVHAQSTTPRPSADAPPGTRSIPLTVPVGTPLQVALDREVRIRKVGQPIHGRLVQSVYAFDRLVIPAGSAVTGRILQIERIPGKQRTLAFLNADFTPDHSIAVEFTDLTLADGRHLPLHTVVTPGSGQVIRLLSAGDHDKKHAPAKDAAAQQMEQAKQQWHNAMQQVHQPGKLHRALRYGVAQLPVHPQYIEANTLYFADLQQPLSFGTEPFTAQAASTLGIPPPGSLVHARLVTPLDSGTTQKGTIVEALLAQPLLDNGHLVVPQGSQLRGSVLQVQPARRLHHNGQMRIAFHTLVLPDGTVERVDTSLEGVQSGAAQNVQLDTEGGAKATAPKSRYITTGVSVGLALIGSGGRNDVGEGGPVAGGATAFKLVGIAVGLIVRSHTLGIVMSAYGGGRSIYTNFLGRGRNIVFPKDTAMDIGFGDRTAQPMPTTAP